LKVLLVHQKIASFVEKDLRILQEAHEVRPFQFRGMGDIGGLWQSVRWCDMSYSWFGKLHAFFTVLFSRVLGKKAIVVAGGDDVERGLLAGRPYGMTANPFKRWFAHFIFRSTDLILSVSRFNLEQTLANTGADPRKTMLVYHGFDADSFKRKTNIAPDGSVVTVGEVNEENYHRKGHRLFVEAAREIPGAQFYLVGAHLDGTICRLNTDASRNVTFTGYVADDELLRLLSRASVYVQASEWESFGCALAEAMLCECVPVVSRLTALPEVVGDCGLYVDRLEPEALAERIEEALRRPELGPMARERVIREFPLERRRRELLHAVSALEQRDREAIERRA